MYKKWPRWTEAEMLKISCNFQGLKRLHPIHFDLINALVDIDQGIYKVKCGIAQNEKKTTWDFCSINMANFEAFNLVFIPRTI